MKYHLDLSHIRKAQIHRLADNFFGKDPQGRELGFTNESMIIDGKPFFAVSGECHYSRTPENQWEDTLLKMKAGGINIVATYVFWNHHEEIEGKFCFKGRRNLRKFITLCQKHGLYVILRIGPFDHGEVRNGGLPDWIYGKPYEVREDNEGFLYQTRLLYRAVSGQIKGLLYKDGGPIIATQIENEYQHSAAPWEMTTGITNEWVNGGSGGAVYMKKLKQIAMEEGIITPFYTCTGWGGASTPTDEMMPLWGGYAFWPWMFYGNPSYEHPATPEYLYRDNHNNLVKETYNFKPCYEPESLPYACCEMGGGMLNFYNYRFQLPFASVDAMANIKLGSGCNFLGYYMYRGGNNPHGIRTEYLNECQCPKISYDFQAPIGEYGQIRPSFHKLRLLHMFTECFDEELEGAVTCLPEGSQDIDPADTSDLRFAARMKGRRGFLFINNYQDHAECRPRENDSVCLDFGDEQIRLEDLSLAAEANCILPINLQADGLVIRFAYAQPLTVLREEGESTWIFFTPEGMKGYYRLDDGTEFVPSPDRPDALTVEREGHRIRILNLPYRDALRFYQVTLGGNTYGLLSDRLLLPDGRGIRTEYTEEQELEIVPAKCGRSRYTFRVPVMEEGAKDVLLRINYRGDVGSLFTADGKLVSDNFSNEAVWETGLFEIGVREGDALTLYITPRRKDVKIDVSSTMAGRMEMMKDAVAELTSVRCAAVRESVILPDENGRFREETLLEAGVDLICQVSGS